MWIYLLAPAAAIAVIAILWSRFIGAQTVYEHQKGLRYDNGKLARVLDAGHYRYLRRRTQIDLVDMRSTMLVVPGQNILTKDNVSVKVSVSGLHQIVDPVKAIQESTSYISELYDICQLSLRDLVATTTIDELLEKKTEIDAQLLAASAAKAERIGVKITALALRDIVLPANLKKAFAAVLEAQKDAQRQLEVARGEQAVLRSLANSAKMYENNPALLQARLIQALSSGANTIVFNGDDKTIVAKPAPDKPASA